MNKKYNIIITIIIIILLIILLHTMAFELLT
jgi:uncharacterized protein YpmB